MSLWGLIFMDSERLSGTCDLDMLWSSLPMGLTWGSNFCQRTAEARLNNSPALADSQLLRDRGLTGRLVVERDERGRLQAKGRLHYTCVDNLAVLCLGKATCVETIDRAAECFTDVGKDTHPIGGGRWRCGGAWDGHLM